MKRLVLIVVGMLMLQGALSAQDPPPPPKPPAAPQKPAAPPAPPPPPPAQGQAASQVNIRVDLKISDTYLGSPTVKTVSIVVMSGYNGRVRTASGVPVEQLSSARIEEVLLNVDAVPTWLGQDQISARITIDYRPAPARSAPSSEQTGSPPMLQESLHVMLRNNQPLIVSQSADPATDRKVTVEVTATIMK